MSAAAMQDLVVLAVIAVAVGYLAARVRRVYLAARARGGCACDDCH